MQLYLQFGFGMMGHCKELLSKWGGGTVVLSPRDLTPEQLTRFSGEVNQIGNGNVLVDPQFYLPHSDHERLCSHSFWPNDYETQLFWQGPQLNELLKKLFALNARCGASQIILPGMLGTRIDDDWLATQTAILDEATAIGPDLPIVSTIALAVDAAKDQQQVANLLEAAELWEPSGYYLVCEHPGDYLVDDPNWLANILDIVAGLRIQGKSVVVGYANHQMLCAASANATAICSGTWMNVRSFPPQKFQTAYDDEIKKRTKWYYCPQSLSEYKVPFLDIAQRVSLLDLMRPPVNLDGGYVDILFSGAQPSTTDFSEQAAFRHYLHALHEQTAVASSSTFDDTISIHEQTLTSTETILDQLAAGGVRGQTRDFADIVDVNRAAISLLSATRGAMLRRRWSSM